MSQNQPASRSLCGDTQAALEGARGCRPGSLVTRAAKPTTETSTDQNFFQKIQVRLRPRRFHEAAKRSHDQVHGDLVTATVVAHGAARPQVLVEAARFQA